MYAKTLIFVAAVITSGSVFAGERMGRDSVHPQPGASMIVPQKSAMAGNGRSSVYAKDVAVRSRTQARYAHIATKPSRA